MNSSYQAQVNLLTDVFSVFPSNTNLVMHGGTAINLFVFDMPRYSVDIDLTYELINDRATAINHIKKSLKLIKSCIEKVFNDVKIEEKIEALKLFIYRGDVLIKLEVNN